MFVLQQVLFETRSLVHGKWPPFTLRKGVGEGFAHRLGYTWIGVTIGSTLFYLFCISTYQLVGRKGANQFSGFTLTANQVLGRRSMSWMLILFVPIVGMILDVCLKLFANMYFPTQTQIHMEMESQGKIKLRRQGLPSSENARRRMEKGSRRRKRNQFPAV